MRIYPCGKLPACLSRTDRKQEAYATVRTQWPKDVAARFTTIRAEGAFLVSTACSNEEVIDVEVSSEAGGPCRFYSPWDAQPRVETAQRTAVPLGQWPEGILSFDTTAGAKYRILPPQQP